MSYCDIFYHLYLHGRISDRKRTNRFDTGGMPALNFKTRIMKIHRRQFERFKIPADTIYLFSNFSPIKGWVKDISKGGMAFEYSPEEGCEPEPEIRVIIASDRLPFYLPDITCKTIYNIMVYKNDRILKRIGVMQCGLQYKGLNGETAEKLAVLLKSEILKSGL